MIEMNIDKAIEQKDDFLEDTVDILKKVKREILSK
jgi:hypothetical protein